MRRAVFIAALLLAIGILQLLFAQNGNKSSIINSKHDFRAASAAQIRSANGQSACIFCHTPHNATPIQPLWNAAIHDYSHPAAGCFQTLPELP